jgi:putative DNA methylase
LGLPAVGSDLNPVPVLITRALTQLVPAVADREPVGAPLDTLTGIHGGPLDGLLADLRHYAERVRDEAWSKVGHLFPTDPDGGTIIAWLWARTVTCPNPACRATIPLYSSPWLSKRKGHERWLKPVVEGKHVRFEIGEGSAMPPPATKVGRGAKFRCLACGQPAPTNHVSIEAKAGRMSFQQLGQASIGPDGRREYLPAGEQNIGGTSPENIPDSPLVGKAKNDLKTYGFKTQADLYTPRQLHALGAFADTVAVVPSWVKADGGTSDYADTIATLLGLCMGKLAQSSSTQVRWRTREGPSKAEPAFGRHALPMVWDFAETNPFGDSVGGWIVQVESMITGLRALPIGDNAAIVVQADARSAGAHLEPGSALVATDPPYFGQIGYADLSDYFYVWHRRALRSVHPDLFGTITTPKDTELIATPYRHAGDKAAAERYFVEGFTETFQSLLAAGRADLPMLVIYAHRQEEAETDDGLVSTAWDAMLGALLKAGLGIVGTWPIHATSSSRQIGQGTNALASYIVMVCRPRRVDAGVIDRQGFLRALRAELPSALRALQDASIPPLDLTQAAIGPGMAVFSRFDRVVEATGDAMPVRTALGLINQVRSELLSELEDEFDAETRWALQWFEEYGFEDGPFGRAEVLFTATATSLDGLRRAGIVTTRAPKVWLRHPDDLTDDWRPEADRQASAWEATLHLVKRLTGGGGEAAAADLLRRAGHSGELARDLAYRLADTCERKKWAKLALSFNALVVSWPEITRLAAELPPERLL